ncbi:hypothetical protein EDC04DRAFT_2988234 [Pisolithus marmoratus]|nr:hypothetical protein EDC04DRAFT_2988234 [Pisolithus marmoratus]
MMCHRRTRSLSDSDAASLHESPPPRKKLKKGSRKWPEKEEKNKLSLQTDPQEIVEYAAAARTIARCHDIFCEVSRLLDIGLLLQQEELAANGDLSEDEDTATAWERALSKLSPTSREQYKHTYDALLQYAPGLKQLLNNRKKKDTLREVITEASCSFLRAYMHSCFTIPHLLTGFQMNKAISGAHSDDTTCLKVHVGVYAALHPLKAGLEPPLSTTGTRSVFGLNHLFLTKLLCPSSAQKDCASNPKQCTFSSVVMCSSIHSSARTHQELLEGRIAMTANDLPLFLWSRDTPGCNIDDDNEYEDLFQGYYLERVMHHIFTGPSTALGEVHFAISSWTKWAEMDGTFNYHSFYYNIIDMIRESPDKEWVEWLKKWWNVSLFKSKMGREAGAGAMEPWQDSDDVVSSMSNDLLSRIQAQMAACVARHTGPPDASSSSSRRPLPPADPSLQSSRPSASCGLDIPPSESHPHPPLESCPHSPSELQPFQPLSTPHREPDSCPGVHDQTLESRPPLVSPVGSILMPLRNNSQEIAPKEVPVAPSTWHKAKKASSKGKGRQAVLLDDEDEPSGVWHSPRKPAAVNGDSMRLKVGPKPRCSPCKSHR